MKITIITGIATFAIASAAQAQQAVQWEVTDGGNGNWYQLIRTGQNAQHWPWSAAAAAASARGAHLVTFSSEFESSAVYLRLGLATATNCVAWIGFMQMPGSAEPGGGWRWVTMEPTEFLNWKPGYPDDSGCSIAGDHQDFAVIGSGGDPRWDDSGDPTAECPYGVPFAVIEYDADCNQDGIVDYGQCHDGTLPDYNGNNIPDCCDEGVPCVPNMIDNGSFELGIDQSCGWICLQQGDPRLPGWEVTLNSVDRERTEPGGCNEGWFASHGTYSLDMNGCSVGGKIQQSVVTVPGTTYVISFDLSMNPTNVSVGQLRVRAGTTSQEFDYQRKNAVVQPNEHHDFRFTATTAVVTIEFESLNREYPAQWNGPVLDAIRMVPDMPAQPTCHDADLYPNNRIDGADLGILLSEWGPVNPSTNSDINHDSFVNGADLGILLSFWGACQN